MVEACRSAIGSLYWRFSSRMIVLDAAVDFKKLMVLEVRGRRAYVPIIIEGAIKIEKS